MSRELWAQRKREMLAIQRRYLLGIAHDVTVWPELARKRWLWI